MQPGSEAGASGNLALSSSSVGGTGRRGLRLYQSLTSASTFGQQRASAILGNGSAGSPWHCGNHNTPVDDTSSAGNVVVTFTGPVRSFQIRYWNSATSLGSIDTDQGIYLAGFEFSATPADC